MRFAFVDQISERTGGRDLTHAAASIRGLVRFGAEAPLRYQRPHGGVVVAPGSVSEAIGQLASWLCLERNDFSARPVFLFADSISVKRDVPVGSDVELWAEVRSMDAETFVFSGVAKHNGEIVQTIANCNGYFMPLAELEDPDAARERFGRLTDGGILYADGAAAAFRFEDLIASCAVSEDGQTMTATAHFAENLPFYRDHFPRFPVTPIVMLNEIIGQAAIKFLGGNGASAVRIQLIKDIKIRNFVKPGEAVEIKIKVESREETADGERVVTVAELAKEKKRILRGLYEYQVTR